MRGHSTARTRPSACFVLRARPGLTPRRAVPLLFCCTAPREEGYAPTADAVRHRLRQLGVKPAGEVDPEAQQAARADLAAFATDMKAWTVGGQAPVFCAAGFGAL